MKVGIFLLILCCVTNGAVHAQANALPQARHILVYGDAQAVAIPDRFKIQMTFVAIDPKVEAARARVERNLQTAIAKLQQASVLANEIVATSLQIEPEQDYDTQSRKQVFRGIKVTRQLSASFHEQVSLKRFLSELDTSAEVQVSGVTTALSSEPELKRQLRQKAIENTRDKAETIAKSYGVRLGGLYSVSDTAPEFRYGITEGDWPELYRWQGDGNGQTLDRVEVTGSTMADAAIESFQTGYVDYQDRIYAVFLIADESAPPAH